MGYNGINRGLSGERLGFTFSGSSLDILALIATFCLNYIAPLLNKLRCGKNYNHPEFFGGNKRDKYYKVIVARVIDLKSGNRVPLPPF